KFTVPDILAGNLYFSAEVDYIGGQIKLIAKKDLGRATFYWDPVRAFETRVSQYFIEEKVPSGRKVTVTTKNEVKKSVPTTRSTLVFRVLSTAEAVDGIPQISVKSAIGAVDGQPSIRE
ncbi:MAG: hypothetical protein AB7H97_14325, partial [Pseudobdellovibrionaceae bacterium]